MVVDEQTDSIIWQRVAHLFEQGEDNFEGRKALGLNARFRFYRYQQDDFFKPHIDGSGPGSRVINNTLVSQAYDDRWSEMTFFILLNDEFDGGETQFIVHKDNPNLTVRSHSDTKLVNTNYIK